MPVWQRARFKGEALMRKIKIEVFLPPFLLILFCIGFNLTDSTAFNAWIQGVNGWITTNFGWFIILLSVIIFLVCIAIYFSDFGKIRIGGEQAKPVMRTWEWFSINICTTIACGIIFWSAAESIQHLLHPPESLGLEPMSAEAAKFAMSAIYTHWTVLPYGIYTIAAVMFAFGYYNLRKSFSLGTMITVLSGGKEHRALNAVIDSVCLFTLIAGLAGSLGVGVLNLSGGLHNLLGLTSNARLWTVVMAIITITFLLSAASGIMHGVRRLSNLNVYIYIFIVLFVLIFGGTRFICTFSVESLGQYIGNFFNQSLYTGAFDHDGWAGAWPVFYMCSWMAWAPITAIFLGRIAYGRRIKDLVAMNLFSTPLFSVIWFSIMSGSTINFALNHPDSHMIEAYTSGIENTIYQLFENMPATELLTVIFLIAVFLSFVTAADSTTIAMADLTTRGVDLDHPDSPKWMKAIWAILTALISLIMMNVGKGADGLKIITNIGGLPAALFLLLVVISAIIVLFKPKEALAELAEPDRQKNVSTEDNKVSE